MTSYTREAQTKCLRGSHRLFYHLPPTAVPIKFSDVYQAFNALINPMDSYKRFLTAVANQAGTSNCYMTSSGRSALALILITLKRHSARQKVILPAYTCPTVAQAVQEVGLVPIFCDVNPQTLDLHRESLQALLSEDVLAIIPTYLYGLTQDISYLTEIGQELGIYIIEDAAQAFGATIQARMVGGLGDFGFFSLGFGKCVPGGGGGIIITQDGYIPAMQRTIEQTTTAGSKRDIASLLRYLGYGLATTPMGWWFVARSPLNPAKHGMDLNALPMIRYTNLSPTIAGIGTSILERIDSINTVRRANAQRLKEILAQYEYINMPTTPVDSQPVYLRFPIIVDTKNRADQLYGRLSKAGIGVSKSYTRILPEIFSITSDSRSQGYVGAKHLSACLLTLPTHALLTAKTFSIIQNCFDSIDD